MKNTTKRLALVMLAIMLFQALCAIPAFAAGDDAKVAASVQEARAAAMKIQMIYINEDNEEIPMQYETGFYIHSSYILTCYHGVKLTADDVAEFMELNPDVFGEHFKNNYKTRVEYRIMIDKDVYVTANITEAFSEVIDFAVLKLNTPLKDITVLPLGKKEEVEPGDQIYCIGFPSVTDTWDLTKFNSIDDLTTTDGVVSKFNNITGTEYILHTSKLAPGCSGGPTLLQDGTVVGVNAIGIGEGLDFDDYFGSVSIDHVTKILDKFGIPYTPAGETVATEETCEHDWGTPVTANCVSTYTCSLCQETKTESVAHTYGEWTVAKEATKKELGVEKRVCSGCGKEETRDIPMLEGGVNILLIAIIGIAVVVVVVVVIIIIVIASSGKKNAPAPAPVGMPPQPQRPPMAPPQPMNVPQPQRPPVAPAPSFDDGAGNTTVLNEGAGETTVLGGGAASGALIRVKTGERIALNAPEFVIGKEKRRVNYCIADNSSISRAHAKIVSRGGVSYIVDMNSTNFTFVNGAKLTAGQERALNNGDKIKLSDEEFEFKA